MPTAKELIDADPRMQRHLDDSALYADLRTLLPRADLDGRSYYIVEGDIFLDVADDDLGLYVIGIEAPHLVPSADDGPKHLVAIDDGTGKPLSWPGGLVLSYCVARETFDDDGQHRSVVGHMRTATGDWESVCGVTFEHRADLDAPGALRTGVLFCVKRAPLPPGVLARAFFPNAPAPDRVVSIGASYFGAHGHPPEGILRHELGHVLGFRHEHIRSGAPRIFPRENTAGTIDMTVYDAKSVMHYAYWNHPIYGDVGTLKLEISPLDAEGARRIYGPGRPRAGGA